mmetsp:Transcript_68599/g.179859  ORF Transcript_68599/g.179859 Transcript_68599/m.179859 type:complete len:1147 (-) Transcript_68599:218-3658(-)
MLMPRTTNRNEAFEMNPASHTTSRRRAFPGVTGRALCLALAELLVVAQIRAADSALPPGGVGGHSLSAVELSRSGDRHSSRQLGLVSPNASAVALGDVEAGGLFARLQSLGAKGLSTAEKFEGVEAASLATLWQSALAAEGHHASEEPEDDGSTVDIVCGVQFKKHPDSVTCPAACPFMRMEIGGVCDMSCVIADNCKANNPIMNYADLKSLHCKLCKVAACKQCGDTSRTCATCQEGYMLSEGGCLGKRRWYWRALYFILATAGVTVLAYVVTTMMRPVTNPEILEHARQFREFSKRRDDATGKKYPLDTDIQHTYISGVGVMLHFKFQYWAVLLSFFIFALLWVVSLALGSRPAVTKTSPIDEASFDVCNAHIQVMVQEVEHMETVYFWTVVFIYLLTTAACVAFAVHQRRFANKTSEEQTTMQDYCLTVRGLPKRPGTEPVEEDLKRFFAERLDDLGVDIVGVSVCWDYRTCVARLEDQVEYELEKTEEEWESLQGRTTVRMRVQQMQKMRTGEGCPSPRSVTSAANTPRLSTLRLDRPGFAPPPALLRTSSVVQRATLQSDLQTRLQWLSSADAVFLMGDAEDDTVLSPEEMGQKEIRAMLENMLSSGKAFLIFNTEGQRDAALQHFTEMELQSNGKPITFKAEDTEPETVLWKNSGTKDQQLITNMVIGIIGLVFGIALLDIFFYFPSIAYFLSMSNIVGMTHGGFQGTLLGMLVCICNQCIYFMIGYVADGCGFTDSDAHQKFYVVGYTSAVFINTIIDLFVVMLLAQGYSMDQAIHMQTEGHGAMSTRAISESPSMQKAVYDQYWAYIFPSCLLIPFLMEPIAAQGIYMLKAAIVGSHPEVSVQEAELQLQCPPFDLARYGDILVNMMLCLGVLAFTYRDLYQLFGCLFLSLGWLYVLDTFRFLRSTMKGSFVSSKLDVTAQFMCSVPCGILAGCIAFRLCGNSSHEDLIRELPEYVQKTIGLASNTFDRDKIVVMIFLAVIAHICAHCAVLKHLVPGWSEVHCLHDREIPYAEKANNIPCNWFNANPVYCLRSKYIYNHSPPCIKFAPGKEYLLKANSDIGLHYEHREAPVFDSAALTFRSLVHEVQGYSSPTMKLGLDRAHQAILGGFASGGLSRSSSAHGAPSETTPASPTSPTAP